MTDETPGTLEIEDGLGGIALAADGPIAGMIIVLAEASTWEVTLNGIMIPGRDGNPIKYIAATYRIEHYGDGWSLAFLHKILRG